MADQMRTKRGPKVPNQKYILRVDCITTFFIRGYSFLFRPLRPLTAIWNDFLRGCHSEIAEEKVSHMYRYKS